MSSSKHLFTTADILDVTEGEYAAKGPACAVYSVCVDSRKAGPNSLFVPLRGERTDGHHFIGDAVKHGACGILCEKRYWENHGEKLKDIPDNISILLVENTYHALWAMAKNYMSRFKNCTVVGITGSSGKTTTKELIGTILKAWKPTAINPGNYNSEIGLPLSVFQVDETHRYAVFEMGMNRIGEIGVLADIVRPDFALITNIGTAHIGMLGGRDNILEEKIQIFSKFSGTQTGFMFEGDAYFTEACRRTGLDLVPYGVQSTKGYQGEENLGLYGTAIYWEGLRIRLGIPGKHNVDNALGAITVAHYLGVPKECVKQGIEAVHPLSGRGEVVNGEVTVINDAYNANPESVESSVGFLNELTWEGRKIVVCGAMKELGGSTEEGHDKVRHLLEHSSVDYVFLYGAEFRTYAFTKESGTSLNGRITWTDNFTDLESRLNKVVKPKDLVLLKGSRSMLLERLVNSIHGDVEV